MPKPLQIAHRGGSGLRPENTIDAFTHAMDVGADGIEIDVHLTRDGIAVVHHDESLKPAIARGADGQWLTRLEDVYNLVSSHAKKPFHIYVELKTALLDLNQSATPEALADEVVRLTRQMGAERRVTLVSFDWRALAHAKKIAPEIKNAFTTNAFFALDPEHPSAKSDKPGSDDAAVRAASAAGAPWAAGYDWRHQTGPDFATKMLKAMGDAGAEGWFAWHGDVTAETMKLARERHMSVSCWTVDEPAEMARLIDLGVDAILTDRPDRLKTTLET